MDRVALAAALTAGLAVAATGCYSATSTPSVVDDVQSWRQAQQRRTARNIPAELTLDDAVRLAQAASLELRMADADVDVARAGIRAAGQPRNPQLRVSNVDFDDLIEGDPNVELSLRFPIPVPGRLAAREDAARARVHRRRAGRRATEADIRGEVVDLFVAMWAARERIGLEKRRLGALQAIETLERERTSRGIGTMASASQARLAVVFQERKVARLVSGQRAPHARLARLIGAADDASFTTRLPGAQLKHTELPTDEALVKLALQRRHQPADAAWAVNAARARVYVERSEGWPWFDFAQLGYRFQSPLKGSAFEVTIGFTLPLFHQNQGGIQRARAQLLRAQLERERWAVTIGHEITTARRRLESALAGAKRSEAMLLAAAARHVGAVAKAVAARTATLEQLERARLRQLDAEAVVLSAKIEARYARAALERAGGGPLGPQP